MARKRDSKGRFVKMTELGPTTAGQAARWHLWFAARDLAWLREDWKSGWGRTVTICCRSIAAAERLASLACPEEISAADKDELVIHCSNVERSLRELIDDRRSR